MELVSGTGGDTFYAFSMPCPVVSTVAILQVSKLRLRMVNDWPEVPEQTLLAAESRPSCSLPRLPLRRTRGLLCCLMAESRIRAAAYSSCSGWQRSPDTENAPLTPDRESSPVLGLQGRKRGSCALVCPFSGESGRQLPWLLPMGWAWAGCSDNRLIVLTTGPL